MNRKNGRRSKTSPRRTGGRPILRKSCRRAEDIDLTSLTERVRKVYIRERRIFEGLYLPGPCACVRVSSYVPPPYWSEPMGPSATDKHRGNVWMELAKTTVVFHGWDSEDYIRMSFDLQPIPYPLEPDELLDWDARNRYIVRGHDQKRVRIHREMRRQQEAFRWWVSQARRAAITGRTRRSVMALIHDVLLVEEVEPSLSPLFRVCIASRYELEDVAERYWEAAAWTYWRFREDYGLALWDFVPARLKKDAGRLYHEALVRLGLDDASL
jgi:hypothetical protein